MNAPIVLDGRRLKIGDRVLWQNDHADAGTVTELNWMAVKIAWDNGQTGTIAIADLEGRVSRQDERAAERVRR